MYFEMQIFLLYYKSVFLEFTGYNMFGQVPVLKKRKEEEEKCTKNKIMLIFLLFLSIKHILCI